jgi:tRNA dimethylallyltransferase
VAVSQPLVIAVVGPTATGKSDLGVELALGLGGEVVNADAMQLYRGMDIGTAKLSGPERRGVPHHQLDVLEVSEEASVAGYQRHAREDVAAVHGRGRRVVVVGGSGLYVRALLDRLDIPPTDPRIRAELEARGAAEGPGALHDELAAVDPRAAERIGRANTRRLVRALEVTRITGRPFSATLPDHVPLEPTLMIGLDCRRDVLDERIARRVERMWQQGLVDEVRGLVRVGMGRTASRARGYAEVLAHLAGRMDAEETREAIVTGTRRLARRQMGWFGRDPRVHWLDSQDVDLVRRARDLVAAADAGFLPPASAPRRTLGT